MNRVHGHPSHKVCEGEGRPWRLLLSTTERRRLTATWMAASSWPPGHPEQIRAQCWRQLTTKHTKSRAVSLCGRSGALKILAARAGTRPGSPDSEPCAPFAVILGEYFGASRGLINNGQPLLPVSALLTAPLSLEASDSQTSIWPFRSSLAAPPPPEWHGFRHRTK